MKIEKLNDNQIRCILEKSDLETRKIELSELTVGSEKARAFFDEMMEQASREVGFSPENKPLMVEAIPVSQECIVLVITKVGDPSQFESWLSNLAKLFHPDMETDEDSDDFEDAELADEDKEEFFHDFEDYEYEEPEFSDSDDEQGIPGGSLMEYLTRKVREMSDTGKDMNSPAGQASPDAVWYSFRDLERASRYASFVNPFFKGESILYKDTSSGDYFLLIKKEADYEKDFDRACHLASEFGSMIDQSYAMEGYFKEHHKLIIGEEAIRVLAGL